MRRDPEMRSSWSSSGRILTLIFRTNQLSTESIQRKFFNFKEYSVSQKKSGKESCFCSGLIKSDLSLLFLTVMTDYFLRKCFVDLQNLIFIRYPES